MNGFDEIDYVAIGRRVRTRRIALRLSQRQLAEQIGRSPAFVGYIETGERAPSLETLVQLCRCLDVRMDYLIWGSTGDDDRYRELRESLRELLNQSESR